MSVYDDVFQEDSSSVEMKRKTKEMKIRVAKVIFISSLIFTVPLRFSHETALVSFCLYNSVCFNTLDLSSTKQFSCKR